MQENNTQTTLNKNRQENNIQTTLSISSVRMTQLLKMALYLVESYMTCELNGITMCS